jgi:hypothetical protein
MSEKKNTENTADTNYIVLTKKDILRTKDDIGLVPINLWDGKKIPMRPMSDSFWVGIQNKNFEGIQVDTRDLKAGLSYEDIKSKVGIDTDFREFLKNNYNNKCEVIAYCLFGEEKMTVDEVKSLRPIGIIDELYQKALEVSGVNLGEAVKKFRQQG